MSRAKCRLRPDMHTEKCRERKHQSKIRRSRLRYMEWLNVANVAGLVYVWLWECAYFYHISASSPKIQINFRMCPFYQSQPAAAVHLLQTFSEFPSFSWQFNEAHVCDNNGDIMAKRGKCIIYMWLDTIR